MFVVPSIILVLRVKWVCPTISGDIMSRDDSRVIEMTSDIVPFSFWRYLDYSTNDLPTLTLHLVSIEREGV